MSAIHTNRAEAHETDNLLYPILDGWVVRHVVSCAKANTQQTYASFHGFLAFNCLKNQKTKINQPSPQKKTWWYDTLWFLFNYSTLITGSMPDIEMASILLLYSKSWSSIFIFKGCWETPMMCIDGLWHGDSEGRRWEMDILYRCHWELGHGWWSSGEW